jgi:hypothetical protein
MKGIFARVKILPLPDHKSKQVSTQRVRVLDDLSAVTLSPFIDEHLDSFVKRDLVEFSAHPEAVLTLPQLEAQLKTDSSILLGQLRGLHNAGLVAYHFQNPHNTRVWHLAPTAWARRVAHAICAFWAQYPEKRNFITLHGRRAK